MDRMDGWIGRDSGCVIVFDFGSNILLTMMQAWSRHSFVNDGDGDDDDVDGPWVGGDDETMTMPVISARSSRPFVETHNKVVMVGTFKSNLGKEER